MCQTTLRTIILHGFLLVALMGTRAWAQVELRAIGVQANGERLSNVRIVREEVERTTILPLLPYVFFEKGSGEIPFRYAQLSVEEAELFDVREFTTRTSTGSRSVIQAYYNILNIVGRRLVQYPALILTVVGMAAFDEDESLAELRASNVIKYLESRFPTAKGRVRRGAPVKSRLVESDMRFADETRRVSFIADWGVVRPVVIRDTTTTITPPNLDFEVVSKQTSINEVALTAWQQDVDTPLFSYIDVELPTTPVRWRLEDDLEHQPVTDEMLTAEVVVTDRDYRKYVSNTLRIPVDQFNLYRKKSGKVIGGREIHQYNLILFDRNSYELRPDHIRIIDSLIADDGYVLPTSKIRVYGYADSTGTAEINQTISAGRAKEAALRMQERFRETITATNIEEIAGFGSSDVLRLPDGLSTPESRFYSRTVIIIIESEASW